MNYNEMDNSYAKHIGLGLDSVVLCTISAFWTVADVYSADNV